MFVINDRRYGWNQIHDDPEFSHVGDLFIANLVLCNIGISQKCDSHANYSRYITRNALQ